MQPILFHAPDELHARLKIKAATENKTMKEILITALEEYLGK